MEINIRTIARHILGFLTLLTIKKHHPTVICIMGDGETSVTREILYENIHQKYPARRNLEILEAEFGIPLTTLGILTYPSNTIKWIKLIISSLFRIIYLKPHKHFLIIEIPEINKKITEFWLNKLNPKFILITGKSEYEPKLPKENTYNNVKEVLKKVGVKETIKELPQPRIRIYRENNATVIDATSYYIPPPIKSVLELINLPKFGKIILFSNSKKDQKDTLTIFPNALINPQTAQIEPEDVVIKRGNKKYP
ncbi:hypothetical protein KJ678_03870 [Patescibacteria group bacterium]|nr:hypothetical protein [Patescibacteria group bacterium]